MGVEFLANHDFGVRKDLGKSAVLVKPKDRHLKIKKGRGVGQQVEFSAAVHGGASSAICAL